MGTGTGVTGSPDRRAQTGYCSHLRGLVPGLMSESLTGTKAAIRILWALGMKRALRSSLEDKRSWSATDREGHA